MKTPATPPLLSGALPLLGHALEFARDRGALFRRGHAALGNAFTIRLGLQKAAVLIGPAHHTRFYKDTDTALDMSRPYQFLAPIFGNVAFVADHATYLNQRPVLYTPFQRDKMLRYLEIMDETVRRWVNALPDEGRMELTDAMNLLVQEVAGRAIMGEDFMTRAGREFWELYTVMGKALDPILPSKLPLPKFLRRDRARKRMQAILRPILEDRRSRPEAFDDFLQDFLRTPKADGQLPTDDEILGLVIALLFAGHETTAGQASWTLILLMQHPAYLAKVRAELDERFPAGTRIGAGSLSALSHLRWAIDETTRLRPSADIQIRVTNEDWNVGEHVIPKGWAVFISGEVAHFLPEVFERPDAFEPERFSPERAGHKEHKNAVMGFGGGVHKCPGMNFAQNEMLTIAALLLQQFDLVLETPDPKVRRDLGANRPTETWVRFKRRPAPVAPAAPSEATMQEAAKAGCPHAAKWLAQKKAEANTTA